MAKRYWHSEKSFIEFFCVITEFESFYLKLIPKFQ